MKGKLRLFFVLLLIMAAGWCINLIWYKPFFIELYFERLFIEYGMRHPEMLTKSHVLENYGYYAHNRELNNISMEYRQETFEAITKAFEMLRSYKRNKLGKDEKLSHDVLDFYLEKMIFKQQFFQHEIPFDHLKGVQTALPTFLIETQTVNNLEDAENYLSRIAKISDKIYQYIQTIMLKEEGDKPPVFVFEYMMDQIDCFLTADIESNILFKDFKSKLDAAGLINPDAKSELLYDLKLEIGDNVYPAYRELKIKLEVEREHASILSGIWQYNDGDTYYYLLLNESLTKDTSMYDLENRALAEIDDLHNKIANQLEIKEDKGVREALKDFTQLYARQREGETDFVAIFDEQVKNMLQSNGANSLHKNLTIKKSAPFNANYKLIEYFPASLDGYRKASITLSNYLLGFVPTNMMKGLAISEVFPGTHFQEEQSRLAKNLPSIRKMIGFNVYKYGWKYYVLEQAAKLRLLKNNEEQIGCWQWQLLYAAAAVADLRIHQNMFTREEAVEYMVAETGLPRPLVIIYADRMIVGPAEAPAYLVGFDAFKQCSPFLLNGESELPGRSFLEKSSKLASYGAVPLKFFPEILPVLISENDIENKSNVLAGKSPR